MHVCIHKNACSCNFKLQCHICTYQQIELLCSIEFLVFKKKQEGDGHVYGWTNIGNDAQ